MESVTTPITFTILDMCRRIVESVGSYKLVALLNRDTKEKLDNELRDIPLKETTHCAVAHGDVVINSCGFTVRCTYEPFLPLGRLWVIPEPENTYEFTKRLGLSIVRKGNAP